MVRTRVPISLPLPFLGARLLLIPCPNPFSCVSWRQRGLLRCVLFSILPVPNGAVFVFREGGLGCYAPHHTCIHTWHILSMALGFPRIFSIKRKLAFETHLSPLLFPSHPTDLSSFSPPFTAVKKVKDFVKSGVDKLKGAPAAAAP